MTKKQTYISHWPLAIGHSIQIKSNKGKYSTKTKSCCSNLAFLSNVIDSDVMGVKGNETVTEGDDDNHYEFELRTSPPSDRHKFPNNKNGGESFGRANTIFNISNNNATIIF
ncbi:hypothetical protein I503_01008 [Candida albicans SC5314]|nr:hypothetical protein MG1_01008 [Candida albicans GC75]KGU13278.1 hypothetical protein MEQ_00995 [Candida albicans P87]KGU34399.1 hypothetical protein MGM_01053 [Candida albicans P75063]KGU36822.1 hypothetical protein MGK_00994 [Candida albicans P57055]KHC48166.1 hypothetical protein W5O_01015 [Candida albicans Ca6]KHC67648.1 hypothetical protein MGE_01016 [Candida albicans P75010]KHC74331.1 hypothetical protein MGI_00997 [Candida albicans P75016]KHC89216.1 hypothetical protein I503_01008 